MISQKLIWVNTQQPNTLQNPGEQRNSDSRGISTITAVFSDPGIVYKILYLGLSNIMLYKYAPLGSFMPQKIVV